MGHGLQFENAALEQASTLGFNQRGPGGSGPRSGLSWADYLLWAMASWRFQGAAGACAQLRGNGSLVSPGTLDQGKVLHPASQIQLGRQQRSPSSGSHVCGLKR